MRDAIVSTLTFWTITLAALVLVASFDNGGAGQIIRAAIAMAMER